MPIFLTSTVPTDRPALYQLSIRSPGPNSSEIATFTFPLSPSSLRASASAMSTYIDTQGPPTYQGVTRVVDRYGLAPPLFTIEGTTGWDRHLADGFVLPGLQSMNLLRAFLVNYETLNQQQLKQGISTLYTLEFYDFFTPQFWQIEPIGPQVVRISNDRPLLYYYRFYWAAIGPVGVPLAGELDAIASVLETPVAQAALGAVSTLNAVLTTYGPTGLLSAVTA